MRAAGLRDGDMVDPRSRGADCRAWPRQLHREGRSPLTRGRHVAAVEGVAIGGSIPAHAGQTSQARTSPRQSRVDPRSRGADWSGKRESLQSRGRSPLTRGRRLVARLASLLVGSIPAHAGQTTSRPLRRSSRRVDPRSRGADGLSNIGGLALTGRSPLTRGRPVELHVPVANDGSIPAHAGQTSS